MYLLLIFIALCAHTLLASPIDLSLDDVLNRRSPIGATPNHAITQGSPGPQGPGAKAPTCSGDSKIPYDQSCWDTLQLSAWLDNWNKTTPTCDANGGNGTDCCGPANNPDEPWTTCFLRLALGNSDYDCTQINDQACSLEGFQLNPDYLPSQRAQVRYIVRNIYSLNVMFNSWNTAMSESIPLASNYIADLITFVDPLKPTNYVLQYVLTALAFGLAFLGLPELTGLFIAAHSVNKITREVSVAIQIASVMVQQTPGSMKVIWPEGDVSSQVVQIGDLGARLGDMQTNITRQINAGVNAAMSDVPTFTAFANTTFFSNATAPSIPAQELDLLIGFKTYLLTTAMASNSWRASWTDLPSSNVGGNTKRHCDTSVGSQEQCFNCQFGLSPPGSNICIGGGPNKRGNDWAGWLSPTTNKMWAMDQSGHKNSPKRSEMANRIFEKNWAPLELILDGGFNCTANAGLGDGSKNPMSIRPDGSVDVSCMSQLPIMIGCNQPCPVTPAPGQKCQFTVWDGC